MGIMNYYNRRKSELVVDENQISDFYSQLLGTKDLRTPDEKFLEIIDKNYH
jgi:hypothetical protein